MNNLLNPKKYQNKSTFYLVNKKRNQLFNLNVRQRL